jgi:hypothetical protein
MFACARQKDHDRRAQVPQTAAPGPPARAPTESAYDELRKLIAKVTPELRERAKAENETLWRGYSAAAPKPRVLFEVPARECCPSPSQACTDQHLKFPGLCYENPTREVWGLGPFAIDDDGVFWVEDAVVERAVGFDRAGKLVDAVPLAPEPERPGSLVVTKSEVWLDSFAPGDDPATQWLLRIDRRTHQTRVYSWADVLGKEHQDCGWSLPGNPSRVVRWSGHWPWDIVDVSFLDETRMQISAPHPLHAGGHRYWLDCDPEHNKPATLVIDDHALPAPSCLQIEYVGPEGDTVAGIPYYHFDVHGNVTGVAARLQRKFEILTSGNDAAVGPDGKVYQYVPKAHSVQVVELPWFENR